MATNSFTESLVLDVSSMLFVTKLEELLTKPCVEANYVADLDELRKRFRGRS
jgi:hypothetical protein